MSHTGTSRVHLLVPTGWDESRHPSGGNYYDQRVADGLRAAGWNVHVATAPAGPAVSDAAVARALAEIPDGDRVLVDGLIASPAAGQLAPHLHRLHLTVLMHMPLITAYGSQTDATATASEEAVLTSAAAIVVTSDWSRQQLLAHYDLVPERVHVARPGIDHSAPLTVDAPADPTGANEIPGRGLRAGRRLRFLSVGVLAPHKGQDVLIDALSRFDSTARSVAPDWSCLLVGADDVVPSFAAALRARVTRARLSDRVHFAGVLAREELHRAYLACGLLITPSRAETYGMVVTEAVAHGLPVLASNVGGLPEALGREPDGARPGQLLPPDDPDALAEALARWCCDDSYQATLRAAARRRSGRLPAWDQTVDAIIGILSSQGRRPPR